MQVYIFIHGQFVPAYITLLREVLAHLLLLPLLLEHLGQGLLQKPFKMILVERVIGADESVRECELWHIKHALVDQWDLVLLGLELIVKLCL